MCPYATARVLPRIGDSLADVTADASGPLDDGALEAARAALHAHYRRQFAHLDRWALADPTRAADDDTGACPLDELLVPLTAAEIEDTAPADAPLPVAHGAATRVLDVGGADGGSRVRVLVEPRPLLELLARPRSRPVLLVGAPGAGKSAFLRWCALTGSREASFLGLDRAIPVHVPLAAALADEPDGAALAEHAVDALRAAGPAVAGALSAEAARGRVVFLLDGLDQSWDVQAAADAVAELARRFPAARVIVTARPAGLAGVRLAADRVQLEGLDGDAIAELLIRWCEVDARRRVGADAATAGRADGEQLAGHVLGAGHLHDLAATPLHATMLAAMYRAGLELPEQRAGLHERVLALLAARWSRLRDTDVAVSDLVAVLAPVALAMIGSGRRALDEDQIRSILARPVGRGGVRGFTDADELLGFLRGPLGVLAEQGPGVLGFAHDALTEHLAARRALQSDKLESVLADASRCFSPTWHEVIRHALGIVGLVQGDEARLASAVRTIVEQAAASRAWPTPLVPELLGAILLDDPGLTAELATAICHELVPAWWFDGAPLVDGEHAGLALAARVLEGRWQVELATAIRERYLRGWGERAAGGLRARLAPMGLLRRLGLQPPLLLCEALVAEMVRGDALAGEPATFTPVARIQPPDEDAPTFVRMALHASGLAALLRAGAGGLFFAVMPGDGVGDPGWNVLDDTRGHRLIGHRLDTPPPSPIPLTGTLHIGVAERPDPALLPNVLAAWHSLHERYPDGPPPPDSVEDAMARYGAADVN